MGKYGKTAVNDVNKVADDFLKGIEKPKAQEESKNKENKKVGPKPKEASKKRTLTVIIKITADEKKEIEKYAEIIGTPVAVLARQALLKEIRNK